MPRAKAPNRKLSAREEEVIRLLAWGATHKEIASALHLSVKTVETHKANAARKLRLRTRQEVVRYAVEQGWLAVAPITALERRIAALKNELAAMKAIVVQGLNGWSPGQPVSPKVNQAFRRVLEIGSSLQEAAVILDQRVDD
jgi:DNA-binding CsgD family transcriptional regulator